MPHLVIPDQLRLFKYYIRRGLNLKCDKDIVFMVLGGCKWGRR
jgi:hypothetical protein